MKPASERLINRPPDRTRPVPHAPAHGRDVPSIRPDGSARARAAPGSGRSGTPLDCATALDVTLGESPRSPEACLGPAAPQCLAQGLDLAAEALVLLGEAPLIGDRRLGAALLLLGASTLVLGAALSRLLSLEPRQEILSGRGIEQAEPLAVTLQVQTEGLAGQPTGDRLDDA